ASRGQEHETATVLIQNSGETKASGPFRQVFWTAVMYFRLLNLSSLHSFQRDVQILSSQLWPNDSTLEASNPFVRKICLWVMKY
ncbi:MAG: hypothetical protein ACYC9J_12560, partial [Sulfuricaulis sp.]